MAYSPIMTRDDATEVSSTATWRHLRLKADLLSRLAPLLVSILSLAISAIPVALEWSSFTFDSTSPLFYAARDHRQAVQAVVSVIAAILGFMWGYSTCGAFNMFMRAWIAERGSMSIKFLQLNAAVSNKTRAADLPVWMQLVSLAWVALALLPAVIWTAALTPGPSTAGIVKENSVPVSQAGFEGQSIFDHYDTTTLAGHCNGLSPSNGTQHSCPGSVFSGQIVDSMRAASTLPNETARRNHTKLDKSGFNYVGRSYGAGASVGLFHAPVSTAIDSYSFTEKGYEANAKCIYNATSAWKFDHSKEEIHTHPVPSIFTADGYRPNEDFGRPFETVYSTFSFEDHRRMIAFSAGGCCNFYNGTGPFFISIAAGLDYLLFNSTQCELFFQPKIFNITVFPVNHTIQVAPQEDIPGVAEGEFLQWTLSNLQTVSMTQTTLYDSTIALALKDNIQSKTNIVPNPEAGPPDQGVLEAMEDSITAAIDDIMEALNGYGLAIPNGWRYETTSIQTSVFKIGTRGFNILIFALNLFSFAVILFVTIYTRLFDSSPAFNFADLPCMIAGVACYIASNLGHYSKGFAENHHLSQLADWQGDPEDAALLESVVVINAKLESSEVPTVMVKSKPANRRHRGQEYEMTHHKNPGQNLPDEEPGDNDGAQLLGWQERQQTELPQESLRSSVSRETSRQEPSQHGPGLNNMQGRRRPEGLRDDEDTEAEDDEPPAHQTRPSAGSSREHGTDSIDMQNIHSRGSNVSGERPRQT